MTRGYKFALLGFALALCGLSAIVCAQAPTGPIRRDRLQRPVYRVGQQPSGVAGVATAALPGAAQPGQQVNQVPSGQGAHPLDPALEIAARGLQHIQTNIKDYSALLIKRERIGGKLLDHEYLFIKVRRQPFSVYTYFLKPDAKKGQEAIYVAGRNNGNLLAHGVGIKKLVGMVELPPTGMLAMQDNRYPITEIGVENLTRRLLEVGQHDRKFGECDVQMQKVTMKVGATSRVVNQITVFHPHPRREFLFNKACIYVDEQLNIPIRYEAYEWPSQPGGQPVLLEEYTYHDVKLNIGLTDADFDDRNPNYGFH